MLLQKQLHLLRVSRAVQYVRLDDCALVHDASHLAVLIPSSVIAARKPLHSSLVVTRLSSFHAPMCCLYFGEQARYGGLLKLAVSDELLFSAAHFVNALLQAVRFVATRSLNLLL